jgi:hypothetical protein
VLDYYWRHASNKPLLVKAVAVNFVADLDLVVLKEKGAIGQITADSGFPS